MIGFMGTKKIFPYPHKAITPYASHFVNHTTNSRLRATVCIQPVYALPRAQLEAKLPKKMKAEIKTIVPPAAVPV